MNSEPTASSTPTLLTADVARHRARTRGAASIATIVKVAFGWGMFLVMSLFYAMLPIASLQLLPFLFFGCVCLLSSIYDETGLSGDCK